MNVTQDATSLQATIGLVVLVLNFFLTVPTIKGLSRRSRSKRATQTLESVHEYYEDEDGTATEQTQKQHSTTIQIYAALASTIVGLAISVTASVLSSIQPSRNLLREHLFTVGSWSMLAIQIAYFSTERNAVRRYCYGCLSAVVSLAICAVIFVRFGVSLGHLHDLRAYRGYIILDSFQLVAALVSSLACLLLPRRPAVWDGTSRVDKQYTVSVTHKYNFSWAGETLAAASANNGLNLADLPFLHLRLRSAYLEGMFRNSAKRDRLWKALLYNHHRELGFQTFFAILQATTNFAPTLVMYELLKLLEQASEDSRITRPGWPLVFALGFSILVSSWGEAWLHWIVFSRLGLPIRSELSAMIFTKATRRKDVRGKEIKDRKPTGFVQTAGIKSSEDFESDVQDDTEEDVRKSRQNTVNLVGVDAKRISDFAKFHFLLPAAATKLIISIIFLAKLIGWESVFAGFAIFIIVMPINIYASKAYSDAQTRLMNVRDQKLVIVTEVLHGIRQIKLSAQEQQWQDKIGKTRMYELVMQWKVLCLDTGLISIWILGSVMLSAISLSTYAFLNGNLSPSVAFTSISLFWSLEMAFAVLPALIADGLEAFVSVNRIDEYLRAPEEDVGIATSHSIGFENASIAWPSNLQDKGPERFILRGLCLQFPKKELSVIVGKTGSGKSLLLAAIIGEADLLSGTIRAPESPFSQDRYDPIANKSDWIVDSAIAFVAQIPWIENASIKNNILFGLPFDQGRYRKVIGCCALEKDLKAFPDGDQTDIGANGINLSGAQRWRVSFARAMYSRAGILILDDVFSAVDPHVGRQLFQDALIGELGQGRTRVLVTHHLDLSLPKAKYSVILGEGTVQYAGVLEDQQQVEILEKISEHEGEAQEGDQDGRPNVGLNDDEPLRKALLHFFQSNISQSQEMVDDSKLDVKGKVPQKFTEEETRVTGSIKLGIYKEYLLSSGGVWFWLGLIVLYTVYESLILGRSWFITIWTRSYETKSLQAPHSVYYYMTVPQMSSSDIPSGSSNDLLFYLGVYLGVSVTICVLGTFKYLLIYLGSIRASKKLFEKLIHRVLRAHLRWLDTVPVGRVLNRLTSDFTLIDSRLGNSLGFLIYDVIQLTGIMIAGLFVSQWIFVFALLLLIVCGWITKLYLAGAREVKRLESNAKSPLFEHFGTVLAGIGTIRAFGRTDAYIVKMFDRIDAHARTSWYLWLFNRWLVWRLNIVGAIFVVFVSSVIVHTGIEASLGGFALSFALRYSTALTGSVRQYADLEPPMTAVERIFEYSKIPIEDQSAKVNVPAAWPTEGRLEISNLVAGYAPDLPPTLKGLSLFVERKHRVGVVGSTGAGKSSLALALLRFLEPREGSIHIDGINISDISLHDLRSRVVIIPQDPILFSGTVRSNLDSFNSHTDADLHDALERAHLACSTDTTSRNKFPTGETNTAPNPTTTYPDTYTNPLRSLSSPISLGGLNLSQGQRQLLCLARAILSRPRIIVLDEATSAIDMATDKLIQRIIREEFQDSTLLVIARRLSTVADFDRVLVMDEGVGVEFGSPQELLERGGWFAKMVERSGETERVREIIEMGGGYASHG